MIGYKGFDKDFKCRDFQYKVGETFTLDGELILNENGFHFSDTPLAVFDYYSPASSRFALVEARGDILADEPHIFATNKLHILKELSLDQLINQNLRAQNTQVLCSLQNFAGVKVNSWNSIAFTSGKYSAAINSGHQSLAFCAGNFSAAANYGNSSFAIANSFYSLACANSPNSVAIACLDTSCAKGVLGSWLVFMVWNRDISSIEEIKAVKVDGVNILPDTFYKLKGGKIIPAAD